MYRRILRKRILKGLVISLALFAVIPVTNAAAKPVSGVTKVQSQVQSNGSYIRALMLRSEALNQKYGLGQNSQQAVTRDKLGEIGAWAVLSTSTPVGKPVASEISTGLSPTQPQQPVGSGGSDFDWGSTGIGVGIAALLIAGTATALFVRVRHQGTLAH